MAQQPQTAAPGSDPRWRRIEDEAEHPIGGWHAKPVGDDLTLEPWLGPLNSVGARYFRIYLGSEELGRPEDPLVFGMVNSGPYPGFNWVEVIDCSERLVIPDGREVTVPEGVLWGVLAQLASLVPAGGHLMAEYDSSGQRVTARALAAGVPPRATPLGAAMAAAGCGIAFRDWYISEGGREGPRKLQGFRALDADHQRLRDGETLATLRAFMDNSAHLDWDVQARTRSLAEEAIEDLEAQVASQAGV
ncbi:MAG TPA: DUF1122 family protein [Dehalococcoidia bacterium]|jgi:hypothetical protein|nr:DUF1122 family protein [Dehalococcoidia bacterium]